MEESAPRVIVAAAQDTGGCNAVRPVLEALRERGLEIRVWAEGPAWSILDRAGFAPQHVPAGSARGAIAAAFDLLSPELVLVGNSCGPSLEDVVVSEARQRGVPSIGVLDSWLLYDRKFNAGREPWVFLPDTLIVMDEHAKREMVDLGAPADRLIALGQPQFDRLDRLKDAFSPDRSAAVRGRFGVSGSNKLVVFFSQDMARFYGGDEKARQTIGYTEYDVIEALKDALSRISAARDETIRTVVKLHPRESTPKYADLGGTFHVVEDADPYDLAMSADLVVGMDTILIVEAGLLGTPTLSVQPDRRGTDPLITNRLGLGRFCYDASALAAAIDRLLYDDKERADCVASMRRFPARPGAAGRVADWVVSHLAESHA